jgi:uncharacterized protein (DUF1810 family)
MAGIDRRRRCRKRAREKEVLLSRKKQRTRYIPLFRRFTRARPVYPCLLPMPGLGKRRRERLTPAELAERALKRAKYCHSFTRPPVTVSPTTGVALSPIASYFWTPPVNLFAGLPCPPHVTGLSFPVFPAPVRTVVAPVMVTPPVSLPVPPVVLPHVSLPVVSPVFSPVAQVSPECAVAWDDPQMPAPPPVFYPAAAERPVRTTKWSVFNNIKDMQAQLERLSFEEKEEDDHNIFRFIDKHEEHFATALAELRNGRKLSHWSWYLLPTPPFAGGSAKNRYYSLDEEAAMAYLEFPEAFGINLRANYLAILRAVADQLERGISLEDLVGDDAPKVLCSAHHFQLLTFCTDHDDIYQVCNRLLRLVSESDFDRNVFLPYSFRNLWIPSDRFLQAPFNSSLQAPREIENNTSR